MNDAAMPSSSPIRSISIGGCSCAKDNGSSWYCSAHGQMPKIRTREELLISIRSKLNKHTQWLSSVYAPDKIMEINKILKDLDEYMKL